MIQIRRPSSVGLVVALLAGIWWSSQIQRFTLAAYLGASSLMPDLGITAATAGFLAAVYFPVYGSLQIPSGILADQGNPRRNLLLSGALMTASGMTFAFAASAEAAILARIAVGLSSGLIWLSMLKLAAEMPGGTYARRLSLFISVGAVGSVVGLAGLPALLGALPWRAVAALVVVPTLVLTVLLGLARPLVPERSYPLGELWRRCLRMLSVVPGVIGRLEYWQVFLVNMLWTGTQFALLTWLPRYARDVLVLPSATVGVLAALAPLGQTVGSALIGSFLGAKKSSNLPFFFGCCVVYTAGLGLLASGAAAQAGAIALFALVFAMGLTYGAFFISLAWAGQRAEPAMLGTVTGVLNGLGFLPAFILPWLMGNLMDAVDRPASADWSYSAAAYSDAFALLFAVLVAGLIGSALIARRMATRPGRPAPARGAIP